MTIDSREFRISLAAGKKSSAAGSLCTTYLKVLEVVGVGGRRYILISGHTHGNMEQEEEVSLENGTTRGLGGRRCYK